MSKSTLGNINVECVIDLSDTWEETASERLDYVQKARPRNRELFTIFRVPAHLREDNENAFEPRIVSFGPYHRRKKRLEEMEMRKSHYLRKFLDRNPERGLEYYLREMEKLEADTRSRYSERSTNMTSEQFTGMMLADGCFIIEFLLSKTTEVVGNPLQRMHWVLPVIAHDMLLLENQLPFNVIQTLFNLANIQTPNQETLIDLLIDFVGDLNLSKDTISYMKEHVPGRVQEIHHVLHLFHSCVILSSKENTPEPSTISTLEMQNQVRSSRYQKKPKRMPRVIPSAVHLHEAGIKFRKLKGPCGIMDVTYRDGVLRMAPFEVYSGTNSLLRNLMAFEQCHLRSRMAVTSFAMFMDCLVDNSDDVDVLERGGVLENALGSEQAAAELFNNLCKEVGNALESNYKELFMNLERHYSSRWPRWRARLVRDYFGNPWSTISLIAAVFLLILTVAQTFYSIIPYYWNVT